MLVVVSPAKKLDAQSPTQLKEHSHPLFLEQAKLLAGQLKKMSSKDLQELMKISAKLGELNADRYKSFHPPFHLQNAKQAALMFQGDTYQGLNFHTLKTQEQTYAQKCLRILSGLYGILRPMDLIQPYRLEMGTAWGPELKGNKSANLYQFWKEDISQALNNELKQHSCVVNCSSLEYFKAIDTTKLIRPVVHIVFKEEKNGALKIISFNAKRARGMMARYIIQNRAQEPDELKNFKQDNYRFDKKLSSENELVFIR